MTIRIPKSKSQQLELLSKLLATAKTNNFEIPEEIAQQLSGIKPEVKFTTTPEGWFCKSDGTAFSPHCQNQKSFAESLARFVALFSGRGGGKSCVGAQRAIKKISQGQSGLVYNPDFENLKISTWPELREWIPWDKVILKHRGYGMKEWRPNSPFEVVFENGATMILKGVSDPGSARGPNVNWLWYDEAGRDLTGDAWKVALASVRIGDNPQAWITTTPLGREHWTYKFFVKQEGITDEMRVLYEKSGQPLIEYYHISIEDNKDNLDPGFYNAIMMSYVTEWERQREVMGEFADAGGVLGDRAWFRDKVVDEIPEDAPIKKRIRFWDLAASERKIVKGRKKTDPDETVGTLMASAEPDFYIQDQIAGHWVWEDIKSIIIQTAKMDGPLVQVYCELEPGSGGINQVAELTSRLKKELPGWPELKGWRPEGDKVVRSGPLFSEAKRGHIYLVKGTWTEGFLDQFASFPIAIHDDRVDSASSARHVISPIRSWKDVGFLSLASDLKKEEEKQNVVNL